MFLGPSNRASTTLRYTPDKPYKLQISAVNSEVEIFGATDDLFYIRHGRNYGFYPKSHLREKAKGNFPHTIEIDLNNLKGINPQVRQENFLYQFLSGQFVPQIPESDNITTDTINSTTTTDKAEVKLVDSNEVPETTEKKPETIQPPVPVENKPEEPQLKVQEQQPKEVPASIEKTPEVPDNLSVEEDDEDVDDTEDDEFEEDDDDSENVEMNPIPEANDKPFVPPPMPAMKAQENPDTKQPELMVIPPSKDTDSKPTENVNKDELSNEIPPLVQPKQPSFTEEILDFFDFGSETTETPEPTPQTAEQDFKVLQQNVPEFVPMKEEVVEKAKIIASEITSEPIPVQNQTMPEKVPENNEVKVEEKAAEKVPEMVVNKVVEPEKQPKTVPETVPEVMTEKVVEKVPEAVIDISTKMPPQVIEQSKIVKDNIPEYKTDYYNDTESVQASIPITEKPIVQEVFTEKPIVQEIVTDKPMVQDTVKPVQPIVQEPVKKVVTEKPIVQEVITEKPIVQEIVTDKPMVQQTVKPVEPIVQEPVKEVVTEKPIVQEAVKPRVLEVVTEKPFVKPIVQEAVQPIVTEKPIVQEVVTEKPIVQEIVQETATPKEEPAIIERVPEPVQDKPLSSSQEALATNEKATFDAPKYDPLPIMDLPTTTENQQYDSVPTPAPDTHQHEDMQVKPKQIFNSDPLLQRFDRGGVGSVVELVNNKPETAEQVLKAPESELNKIDEIPVHEDVDEVKKEESGGFFGRAFKKLKIFSDDDDSEQHFHKKDDHHHEHNVDSHNHVHSENAHDHSHNTNDHTHHNHDHSHNTNDHVHHNNDHSHDHSHTHEPLYSQNVNEQQQKPSDVVGEYFKHHNYINF